MNEQARFRNGYPVCSRCGGQVLGGECLQCGFEVEKPKERKKPLPLMFRHKLGAKK